MSKHVVDGKYTCICDPSRRDEKRTRGRPEICLHALVTRFGRVADAAVARGRPPAPLPSAEEIRASSSSFDPRPPRLGRPPGKVGCREKRRRRQQQQKARAASRLRSRWSEAEEEDEEEEGDDYDDEDEYEEEEEGLEGEEWEMEDGEEAEAAEAEPRDTFEVVAAEDEEREVFILPDSVETIIVRDDEDFPSSPGSTRPEIMEDAASGLLGGFLSPLAPSDLFSPRDASHSPAAARLRDFVDRVVEELRHEDPYYYNYYRAGAAPPTPRCRDILRP